jgi:integrase
VVVDLPRHADGKRRQKWHGGYRTKKAAEAVRARLIHELSTGYYVEPSTMRFDEWLLEFWMPVVETRVKTSTAHAYNAVIRNHVAPELGGIPLANLKPQMFHNLYQRLLQTGNIRTGEGLAVSFVRGIHSVIRKSLNDAVDAGLLPRSPAKGVKPPRDRGNSMELRYWTPAELKTFLDLIRGHRLGTALHLTAMTGARRGEIAGLRWVDVDLDVARITIRQTLLTVGGTVEVSSPKSNRGRTIDLDERTVALLRRHLDRQQARGEAYLNRDGGEGYVFRGKNGSRIHPQALHNAFRWIVDKSDLPRIRLHDLRHTHASIAVKAGVPIGVVSERLGHSDPGFTLARYSHVMPGMQREAADKIARAVHLDDITSGTS